MPLITLALRGLTTNVLQGYCLETVMSRAEWGKPGDDGIM